MMKHNVPTGSSEATETVFLDRSPDVVSAILRQLHQQGIQIALDDFGTGYASPTHLKQFPVHHIKIDRSFFVNPEQDVGDDAIVAMVIGLGRNLNMQVTAEGVETIGQAQRLREMDRNNARGYLYAKPVECSRVPQLLVNLETNHALPVAAIA